MITLRSNSNINSNQLVYDETKDVYTFKETVET